MSEALQPSARQLVLADLLPRRRVVDVVLVLAVAALTGLSAQLEFHLPHNAVPVTLQTFVVLAGGAALGAPRAFAAFAVYAVAGMAGLPWFSGQTSGWSFPSFGYIVGFLVAGTVVGALAQRGEVRTAAGTLLAMLAGTVIIYAIGVPWLMHELHVPLAKGLELGVRPFLVLDGLKIAAAMGVLPLASRLLPRG